MELIQIPDDSGYPTEYLLSRIRGRRAYLLRDWDEILFKPNPFESLISPYYGEMISKHSIENVWKRFLNEFTWVYLQMNKKLRNIFKTFFTYHEIRTLIICFRFKTEQGTDKDIENILSFSLLSEKIKAMLKRKSDLASVLGEFDKRLLFSSDEQSRLKETIVEKGLKGVEQRITCSYLEKMAGSELHPVIKRFFTYVIDSKNLTTLYKYLRWNIKEEPKLIPGGSIGESRLRKVLSTREISSIALIMYRLTGIRIEELSAFNLENILLKGLTKQIKIIGRESLDIGLILDYLWRCSNEAKNLSIILFGREIDRNVLKREIVT